jgi:uncharacterized protein (TIGR00288 family)
MEGGIMSLNVSQNQRSAILVDNSNLYRTSLELGVKVDYFKLLKRFNHRQIVRALIFQPELDSVRESGFMRTIRSYGFEFKTKPVKTYENGKTKCDMDVDLTVAAVSLVEKCDVITIISGDGDFLPLIYHLKSRGVKVEIVGFVHNTSHELKTAADEFYPITADLYLQSNEKNSLNAVLAA